jgi:hypothetical protein
MISWIVLQSGCCLEPSDRELSRNRHLRKHSHEIHPSGTLIAITSTAAIGSADAASPYDGSWSVIITTVRGGGSGSGFGLQIRDGAVYGGGGGFNLGSRHRACERQFR